MSTRFFYCADGANVSGPVDRAELQRLFDQHVIGLRTPVAIEGEETWHHAELYVTRTGPTPPPPTTSQSVGTRDLILFESRKKSRAAACILNFFIPGIGYCYAGMWVIGLLVLFIWGFCALAGLFPICLVLSFIGAIDGLLAAGRANRKLAARLLRE